MADLSTTIISAEGISAGPTSPTWLSSLPVRIRAAPSVSQWPEHDAYSDFTLDVNQDTHLDETPATAEPEYKPTANFNSEEGRHGADHCPPGGQSADGDDSDTPESTEELIAKFDERMDKLEITFALTKAVLHLDRNQDIEAEDRAQQGLEGARRLGDEATIARCLYWLGRIEYYRGNGAKARRHFLDARPCIGVYDEGQDIPVYLSLFQRGVTEDDRERIIRSHVGQLLLSDTEEDSISDWETMHADAPSEASENQQLSMAVKPERVRKRKTGSSDILNEVLRTSRKGKREKTKPRLWLVRDRADIYPHARDDRRHLLDQKRDLMWLTAAEMSCFRPQQGHFTFTMYPKGLAPRNRKTDIFHEQRWEWIMPRTEWEDVQEAWKEKSVTMAFLTCERQELVRRAIQKPGWKPLHIRKVVDPSVCDTHCVTQVVN